MTQWDHLSPNEKRSHKRDRGPASLPGAPIREFVKDTVLASDGTTEWHTRRSNNVESIIDPRIVSEGHPSALVTNVNTPLALFSSFMTDRMLEDVVRFTNIKIGQLRSTIGLGNIRKSTNANIDLIDLKYIIGMLIMSGSKKDSHVRTLDMFSTCSGRAFYRVLYSQI